MPIFLHLRSRNDNVDRLGIRTYVVATAFLFRHALYDTVSAVQRTSHRILRFTISKSYPFLADICRSATVVKRYQEQRRYIQHSVGNLSR